MCITVNELNCEWLSRCHNVTLSQGVHRCDNEFIKENSDIREFSEFRDIMERGAGGEYAPLGRTPS